MICEQHINLVIPPPFLSYRDRVRDWWQKEGSLSMEILALVLNKIVASII